MHTLSSEKMRQVASHRYRQSAFYAACMKEMKVRGSSWVIHVDTDEFVTTENPFAKEGDLHEESASTEDSVLRKVQKHVQANNRDYPCYSVFRVPYGSIESSEDEVNALVPSDFDAKQFETLRWRHHSSPEKMMLFEHYPKVIVDVSVLPAERLSRETVSSIHRPFWDICEHIQEPAEHKELYPEQGVVANHYIGSWERYGAKKDDRRSGAAYVGRAFANEGTYDGHPTVVAGFYGFDGRCEGNGSSWKSISKLFLMSSFCTAFWLVYIVLHEIRVCYFFLVNN